MSIASVAVEVHLLKNIRLLSSFSERNSQWSLNHRCKKQLAKRVLGCKLTISCWVSQFFKYFLLLVTFYGTFFSFLLLSFKLNIKFS